MLSAIPVSAKTSIAPGVVIDQAKGSRDWDYGINIGFAGKTKWKSGTYSAELLLPVDLFVKNNNLYLEGQLDLRDPSIDDREADPYMGTATSSSIEFKINSKGLHVPDQLLLQHRRKDHEDEFHRQFPVV